MKTALECLPCFIRQAVDAAKLTETVPERQKKIVDVISGLLPNVSLTATPPETAKSIYSFVEHYSGGRDIYANIKRESNKKALSLYPSLKKMIAGSSDPLVDAVRLAVAGNVIDYGVPHIFNIEDEIRICLSKEFAVFDIDKFRSDISSARRVLYILDNAGEIVLDRILVEELLYKREVVCAVRSQPIINDVTVEDAKQSGLDGIVRVIQSGSDIPGTIIGCCTDEFKALYKSADIVISKGQGNFETLSDADRPIYFIFKVKCRVVAEYIGCSLGDIILKKHV